jgi:AcrR family transcriptional regulator
VLQAAQDILMQDGFGRLTVDAVSIRAQVSKPTIYRHWANAQDLALAALIHITPTEAPLAGTPRARLTAQLAALVTAFATTRGRQITRALASADPESEFTRAFRTRVILSSSEAGRGILHDAITEGSLDPPPDIEVLLDMIYGPLFYRLLVGHQPLTDEFAPAVIATVFDRLGR